MDGTGGTKSPSPTVQNFVNMVINTEFIADCRLPKVFSGLDLNGTVFSLKMNFMHNGFSYEFRVPGIIPDLAQLTQSFSPTRRGANVAVTLARPPKSFNGPHF